MHGSGIFLESLSIKSETSIMGERIVQKQEREDAYAIYSISTKGDENSV